MKDGKGLMSNVLEPKVLKWVFPYAMSFFIIIVISNLTDLVPGVGSIGRGPKDLGSPMPFAIEHVSKPFFSPPTTDANLTVAMAGIFFVMCLFLGGEIQRAVRSHQACIWGEGGFQ